VREDEAQRLRRVEVLGHRDRVLLEHADAFGVGAPHGQGADAVADVQGPAAGTELLDDADQLVTGRERRLRHAQIRTGAQHGIGVGHAGRQHPDSHLTGTRPWILRLHHAHDLRTAEPIDDSAFHLNLPATSTIAAAPSRVAPGSAVGSVVAIGAAAIRGRGRA
jgi:hypothetical protein